MYAWDFLLCPSVSSIILLTDFLLVINLIFFLVYIVLSNIYICSQFTMCQFLVYSTMLQSYMNVHILIFILFFTISYYKTVLDIVPCAIQYELVYKLGVWDLQVLNINITFYDAYFIPYSDMLLKLNFHLIYK